MSESTLQVAALEAEAIEELIGGREAKDLTPRELMLAAYAANAEVVSLAQSIGREMEWYLALVDEAGRRFFPADRGDAIVDYCGTEFFGGPERAEEHRAKYARGER
jgi:hypothetical protein